MSDRYVTRVRYGLCPSDFRPEQLRCDGGEMLRNQIMYFTLVDLFTEKTPIQKNRRVKSGSDGFNAKVNRYCGVSHIMTRIYRVIEINARIYRVAIKTYRICMVT